MIKINDKPTDVQSHLVCSSLAVTKQSSKTQGKQLTTSFNNTEGVLPQYTEEQKLSVKVYVLNINGKPLMPTSPRKARILLKQGKAIVVKRLPFIIKLNFKHKIERVQDISIGIDSGAKFIGFSAISEKAELISGTVVLDIKTSDRLKERAMYRRNRRNRLWYRKPRFNNRTKKEGWLPPSIERKYQTHLTIINKIKSLLPISKVTVEVGSFDIQAIKNPEISGIEYQQGDKFGYENTKAYIMAREKYICQLCGESVLSKKINLHHIRQRRNSGSNSASNLALLHEMCHKKLHKQNLKLKKNKIYRESAFMNIIKWRFKKDIDCKLTFGFKTFCKRIELGLEKTHYTDAFVIAGGQQQNRIESFTVTQKRKHNRAIQLNRKGFKPSIRTTVYRLQPLDLIWINGTIKKIKGVFNKGKYVLFGSAKNKEYCRFSQIEKYYCYGSLAWSI